MFTGLIQSLQPVEAVTTTSTGFIISIKLGPLASEITLGESIAVDGVCLTVATFTNDIATFDVMHETLKATTIGTIKSGQMVNLEKAMLNNGRFGGHIVLGHVDCTGNVTEITQKNGNTIIKIETPASFDQYLIPKGSVALSGVSLTLFDVKKNTFTISLIPTTLAETNLSLLKRGDKVNLEADAIGKWVNKRLDNIFGTQSQNKTILKKLQENGFF